MAGELRRYVDVAGGEVELVGHAGFVQIGLKAPHRVSGVIESETDGGRHWVVDHLDFDDPDEIRWKYSFRYRPGCSCGWRGNVFNALNSEWADEIVLSDDWPGYLPGAYHEHVMGQWRSHTDDLIAVFTELDPIRDAQVQVDAAQAVLDAAENLLRERVNTARERGHSWAVIARRLGVTKQSAWERFRSKP